MSMGPICHCAGGLGGLSGNIEPCCPVHGADWRPDPAVEKWLSEKKKERITASPRALSSFEEIQVGQRVMYVDEQDPKKTATYRVAFVDDPQTILKPTRPEADGWPRLVWNRSSFKAEGQYLILLEDAPEEVSVPKDLLDKLFEALDVWEQSDQTVRHPVSGVTQAVRTLKKGVENA